MSIFEIMAKVAIAFPTLSEKDVKYISKRIDKLINSDAGKDAKSVRIREEIEASMKKWLKKQLVPVSEFARIAKTCNCQPAQVRNIVYRLDPTAYWVREAKVCMVRGKSQRMFSIMDRRLLKIEETDEEIQTEKEGTND